MTFDRDDHLKLGYKSPPPWGRFQKGRSGNPKGRPKKNSAPSKAPGDSATDDILRAELARSIRVKDAKGSRKLSAQELIRKSQMNLAIKGNPLAQREVLKEARALEERDARRKEADDVRRRLVFREVARWKANQTELWAAATREGVEPAKPWPHPDDMHLDEAQEKWRIHGPSCESEAPMYEYFRAERDRLFVVAELKRREDRSPDSSPFSLLDAGWLICDQLLPKRWQIVGKDDHWLAIATLTTRRLHQELERCVQRAAQLEKRAKLPRRDKEAYRNANHAMKPLLKPLGYHSLAHFERVYETKGERQP